MSTSSPTAQTMTPTPVITSVIAQIRMNCDKVGDTPLQLTKNDYVQINIKWAAQTVDQVNDYIESANTQIFLDGEAIDFTTTNSNVEYGEKIGLYYVISNFNIGNLTEGSHIICTVIDLDNKVIDGFVWYGTGTDYPTIDESFTVKVEESISEIVEVPPIIFFNVQ